MPSAAVPQSLRDALGPQAAGDLSAWLDESLDESIRQRAITRDEFREVLSRLDVVDERFEQVDDRFDQMEQRFDQRFEAVEGRLGRLESEMSTLRSEMNRRFDQMNERFDQQSTQFDQRLDAINEGMRRQTRWTVGAIVAIGVILSALLSIAEFAT